MSGRGLMVLAVFMTACGSGENCCDDVRLELGMHADSSVETPDVAVSDLSDTVLTDAYVREMPCDNHESVDPGDAWSGNDSDNPDDFVSQEAGPAGGTDLSVADSGFDISGQPWTEPVTGDFVMADGDSFIVRAHHVRYKVDNGLFGDEWFDHEDYLFWAENDGNVDSRKCMWVSEPWLPEPVDITRVVVLFAGQQGLRQSPAAYANVVAGTMDGWRPEDHKELKDADLSVRVRSIAGDILRDGLESSGAMYGFNPGNTLLMVAMDSGFNYMLADDAKDRAEDAWMDWLGKRIPDPSRIERIFLAGSSRGGCLALRIARRILLDSGFDGAEVLLGTLDGVCRPSQDEGGTTSEVPIHNPLNNEYFTYRTNLSSFLPMRGHDRISVRQVVGGAEVINLGVTGVAHSFVDTFIMTEGHRWPFPYEATWVDLPHTEIGRPWRADTSGILMDWLMKRVITRAR